MKTDSWFSRDVTNFQYSKPGGLQKFYLHLRKDYLKISLLTTEQFQSCVTSGGRLCQSCSVLQNDSSRDFQHSKQCKCKGKYLYKFSNVHKRKQTSLLAKVNDRCFFLFPAAMLVSLRRAPTWRLHIKLYKFVWNIMWNNSSSTENRTDLRLGESPYLFIVYNVSISWLHSLNGYRFLFWWRDSENRQ